MQGLYHIYGEAFGCLLTIQSCCGPRITSGGHNRGMCKEHTQHGELPLLQPPPDCCCYPIDPVAKSSSKFGNYCWKHGEDVETEMLVLLKVGQEQLKSRIWCRFLTWELTVWGHNGYPFQSNHYVGESQYNK